jgi:outer membrane protein OmpA-like peptidoglycan-associated protein
VLLCGCASTGPSQQLLTARKEYAAVSQGPAARYAPDQLHEARNLLQQAESAEDGSGREQQFAYLADRQARKANAEGLIRENQRRLATANQQYVILQEQGRVAAERGLSETQRKLTETQQAQKDAEARADKAMADLEELGRIKEEENETILTLPGEVLFKTGQATLLPVAESRLDSVAKALKQLDPSQEVGIEGHTDSVGSEETNMKLSKERAEPCVTT